RDSAFQTGLQAIELSTDNSKVIEEVKLFYYSRRIAPIDVSKYTAWKLASSGAANSGSGSSDTATVEAEYQQALPPPPPSVPFAQVVDMIRRGETIPGIREIPDEINRHAPSTSTSVAPRKPWEQQ
ncbi:hypothetical protein GGH95_003878, partial [Coemansia sp. RSA 1836]